MWREVFRSKEGTDNLSIKENKLMFCCDEGITYQTYGSVTEAEMVAFRLSINLKHMEGVYEQIKSIIKE